MTNEANFSSVMQFDKDETMIFILPHVDLSKLFHFERCLCQSVFEILSESPDETFCFFLLE